MLWLLSGSPGFTVGFFFWSGIQFISFWDLFFAFLYLNLYVLGDHALLSYGSFMQTKHLCVLIHIWTKGEVSASWNWFKPSSKIFLLTVPMRCFFCGSYMLFLSCFCYAFVHVCLLTPCGHLLIKGWPLGSRLSCLIVKLSLSHVVSLVRCGAWLYRFLVFARFLTFTRKGRSWYCHQSLISYTPT